MKNSTTEEHLFGLALAKPTAERATFLDGTCHDDPALRARHEALLAAHEQPETLLATLVKPARPTIKLDLADAPDETVGQTLGRYKLLERVGEGGCGVVYVAEQTEPVRRRVALKVIKLGMDTKQVVARFEAERQALAMMDHPNIAKVLDAGTTGDPHPASGHPLSSDGRGAGGEGSSHLPAGRPYFVMELVRGTCLRRRNPNGIPSRSPGLPSPRGYPGTRVIVRPNPNGVESILTPRIAATPLGLMIHFVHSPRVARASRPWP